MKRILLTSAAALIASAGMVAAEVKVSGEARFGISHVEDRSEKPETRMVNVCEDTNGALTRRDKCQEDETAGTTEVTIPEGDRVDTPLDDTIFVHRFRVNVDVSTETDGGTEFGGRVRVQAEEKADGESNVAEINGPNFYVSNGGLKVYAGNISGAIDSMNAYYGTEPGLESFIGQYGAVNYKFLGYSSGGAGDNAVNFSYEVDTFRVMASYDSKTDDKDRFDMGVQYGFGDFTVAAAYGQTKAGMGEKKPTLAVLTLAGEFGPLSGSIFVADDEVIKDGNVDEAKSGTAYGLSGSYAVGAATKLTFAYGDGSADGDKQAMAVGFNHDLGGGASLRGGWGRTKATQDAEAKSQMDFGAHFEF